MSGVHDKLSVQCKHFSAFCESLENIVIFGHVATSTLKKHELPSLLLPRIKAIYVFTTCQGLFLVVELTREELYFLLSFYQEEPESCLLKLIIVLKTRSHYLFCSIYL